MNHDLPDIVESHAGKDGLDVGEGEGQLQALHQDSVPLRKIGLLFSKLIFREIVQLREGKNMHIFTSHPVILRQDKKKWGRSYLYFCWDLSYSAPFHHGKLILQSNKPI